MKVNFYEVCLSYIIYCLIFYIIIILNVFLFDRFMVSITIGERISGSIGHKDFSMKGTRNHVNGGGKGFLSLASMRHARI